MKKIKELLAQYGLEYHDISTREELLHVLTRESFIKLAYYLKDLDAYNNPDIYEVRRNIEKLYHQINQNESKVDRIELKSIIDKYFKKIGLDKDSEELKADKEMFLEQLIRISNKDFNFENTIQKISNRDYIKILINSASEAFLSARLANF